MAVDYLTSSVATTADSTAGSTAGISIAYDSLATGSDRALVVVVGANRANGTSAFCTIASGTYNGVAADNIITVSNGTSANLVDLSVLVWKNPATGSNTLAMSFTGTNAHDSYGVVAAVYTGVDQTTPVDVSDTDTAGPATTFTGLSVTTNNADQRIIVGCVEKSGTHTFTPDGSGTNRGEADSGNNATDDSTTALIDYAAATATTYTDSASISSNSQLAGALVALKAASGGGSTATPLHYYRMMQS